VTPQFLTLFRWHVLRYVSRHKLLALLNVLSVALGVAVYLAIQIANRSANESFAAGIDLVAGKAHLEVRGQLTDEMWPKVAAVPGVSATTALVESVVTLPDYPGEYLRLLGVDVFTSAPFRTFEMSSSKGRLDLDQWLGEPASIAITGEFARKYGLKVGDPLRLTANARTVPGKIAALMDTGDTPADSHFAAIDIGWAQELMGLQGRLTAVQIQAADPRQAAALADKIRAQLPADIRVEPPRQRSFQMQTMLSAFELNLTAMSLVSLLVGAFLIYNTIYASVVRRRVELGILRALGATRMEIRWLFLGEACLFGIAGIALGCVGGVALGRAMIATVERTISSLYLLLSIERASLSAWQFVFAAAFGLAAVIVGAWIPSAEASRVDPIGSLSLGAHAERSRQRRLPWHVLAAGSLLLAIAVCALALQTGPPLLAFGGAFLVLAGFAFCAPDSTRVFSRVFGKVTAGVHLLRLASDHLRRALHRNAVTTAALSTALAMTVGLIVMIHSFRESLGAWVERGMVADLFIAPASNEVIGFSSIVPEGAVGWLRQQPGVESVDTIREIMVRAVTSEGERPIPLAAVEGHYRGNLQFEGGNDAAKMARVFRGEAVAVTESLARRLHLRGGMSLSLRTPKGVEAFPIAGVYADYSSDLGLVMMSQPRFAQSWIDPGAESLGVYLKPGADPAAVADAFREKFSRGGEFVAYSNRALRQRVFNVFDQTFAVTYVLRTIALIVAVLGIFLSVTTLVAERQRETGMLRALGASRGQIVQLFMAEAGLIGLTASALGMITGLALALVLTWVVNPAFFGWTIHLHVPWRTLATTPVWIIAATIIAAWWPAWRGSLEPIATSVREE
jgi:putative ABC transport system permease protein